MDQANKELLSEKRWALLDVEFIRISSTHRCIRKLYILHDNGFTDMEMEFLSLYTLSQFGAKIPIFISIL